MEQNLKKQSGEPPFRPTVEGCVMRDPRLARMVESLYLEKLSAIASYTYRSLVTEGADTALSDLFDDIAIDEMRHFQLLGELILALGGNPTVRTSLRVEPAEISEGEFFATPRAMVQMIRSSLREEKNAIDHYRSLMEKTDDRVVRSVFSHIAADEKIHVSLLDAMAEQSGGL